MTHGPIFTDPFNDRDSLYHDNKNIQWQSITDFKFVFHKLRDNFRPFLDIYIYTFHYKIHCWIVNQSLSIKLIIYLIYNSAVTSDVGGDQKLYENHVLTKIGQCVSVFVRVEGGGCVSIFFLMSSKVMRRKGRY